MIIAKHSGQLATLQGAQTTKKHLTC